MTGYVVTKDNARKGTISLQTIVFIKNKVISEKAGGSKKVIKYHTKFK